MKAINFIRMFALIVIIVSAASLTSFAKKPVISNSPATLATIQNTLTSSLKFPDNCIKSDYEGTVDVVFLIEDGKLIVEQAKSENEDLANYVKKELGNICCKHIKSLTNQHYAVKLRFELKD